LVPSSNDIDMSGVAVYVRHDGEEKVGREGGCPVELPESIICSFGIGVGAVGSRDIDVWVEGPDGRCDERHVPLSAYNSCGREISYLVVELESVGSDMQCTYGEPAFVNPCEMGWME
jgi:hypothetical protein